MGISVNFSICLRGVRPPFLLRAGTWDSSRVKAGVSGVILRCVLEYSFLLKL